MTRTACATFLAWVLFSFTGSLAFAERHDSGKELFTRHWTVHDDQCRLGDGLGPMFNARSCADCHHQAGLGGSGDANSNTDILTVEPSLVRAMISARNGRSRADFQQRLIELHPGFEVPGITVVPSIVVHSHSTDKAYSRFRSSLLTRVADDDDATHRGLLGSLENLIGEKPGDTLPIQFRLTHRNTPAIFGAGLIDRIPTELLETTAAELAREYSQVSGRLPRIGAPGQPGRFGWRSQTATLDEFVRGACANELGLQIRGNPQPISPTNAEPTTSLVDLNERQCDSLVNYVRSLSPPREATSPNRAASDLVARGKRVFASAGCVACHVESLGPAQGIYSDLALHDMGRGLEDPWPAPAPSASQVPGYYGGQTSLFSALASLGDRLTEWRTPPLWGVADSAPYLHDGRAPTLTTAIVAHGGEALFSTERFLALPPTDRTALLAFLNTLRAPHEDECIRQSRRDPSSSRKRASRSSAFGHTRKSQ